MAEFEAASPTGPAAVPVVDAVIVNWHTERLIADLVSDLQRQAGVAVRIHVVDCGSEARVLDGMAAELGFDLIPAGRNLGYTGGNNLGFSRLPLDAFVCVINPDVRCPDPSTLATLCACLAAKPDLGAVAPLLLLEDGLIEYAGSELDLEHARVIHTRTHLSEWLADLGPVERISWIDGAMMLLRPEAIRATGGFDERFFLFGEEADLCIRLAKLGQLVALVSSARVTHTRGAAFAGSPKGAYYYYRNLYLLCSLHATRAGWKGTWALQVLRFIRRPRHICDGGTVRTIQGAWDAVMGRWGAMPGDGS